MEYPTEFARTEPYPKITGASYDPIAVREIKKNYCGVKSEATATLQYVYSHFVSNRFAKEIAGVFLEIGEIEMKHLDMLAEAMVGFGGDPQFFDRGGAALSGSWLNYGKGLKFMLKFNLEREAEAAETYRRSAEIVNNPSLKALFLRLAADEDLHFTILKNILDEEIFWSE